MFSITSTIPNLYFSPTLFTNKTYCHYSYLTFRNKPPEKLPPLCVAVAKELVLGVRNKGFCWSCGSGFVRKCKKDWESEGNLDLEEEILEFMKRSKNPEVFPSKKELIDAGRNDIVENVLRQGGWLAFGWDSDGSDCENDEDVNLGLLRDREWSNLAVQDKVLAGNDVREREEVDSFRSNSSPIASSPGRTLESAMKDDSGTEGILTRLEKERNINFGFGLAKEKRSGTHVETIELEHDWLAKNSNSMTVADIKRENKAPSVNFTNGAMNHSAGEISSSAARTDGEMDNLRAKKLIKSQGADASWNGKKESSCDGISHDQLRRRLRLLESELSYVLQRLQSNTGESGSQKGDVYSSADYLKLSDAAEFQENEIMNAHDKLRSIRAKLAVLEGKMALAVIDAQKMVEEKQKRIDDSRRAFQLIRTACIVWPNAATEVLLAGSFDGWTTQREMEKSNTGVFSLYLKLYPGRYEIKFVVDGVWRVDPLRPLVDSSGYENNLLIIT